MGPNNEKLVSVVVLSYNSRATISRALHSIFMQDYPRIEVIVADDGSEDFSRDHIYTLVTSSAGDNIEKVKIVASAENMGTVSNLWQALDHIQGEYFMVIGADDMLACRSSISEFMTTFFYRSWRPLLVTGLAEMWSEDMNTLIRTIPEAEGRAALQSEDPKQLLNALAHECVVPIISTCFHREFIRKANAFDRSYVYYEDYPTFIRMAAKGIAPAYLGKVMVKHAAGGVANGGSSKKVAAELYKDRKKMWRNELKPNADLLTKESLKQNKERRQWERREREKSLKSKKRAYMTLYDIGNKLKRFFTTKVIHRAMQSFRFTVLLLLFCAAAGCLKGFWDVIAVGLALLDVVAALCSIWFIGLGVFRLARKTLIRKGV